jgi:predicted TIM-barrel fold metal-dependent hydrolase
MALYRDRRYPEGEFPRFEELLAERDRMFKAHPNTKFIAAHFGYRANNLVRAAKMLDTMPNVYLEVAAIHAELGRQPRTAHEFFVKYQDRVLFGKDSFQPDEYPYYWRVFETRDEYFDYYRDYHAFWKLYGMGLPDDVLRKLYYKNALKLVPGLPKDRFPG